MRRHVMRLGITVGTALALTGALVGPANAATTAGPVGQLTSTVTGTAGGLISTAGGVVSDLGGAVTSLGDAVSGLG
jgi:hypothetical protein